MMNVSQSSDQEQQVELNSTQSGKNPKSRRKIIGIVIGILALCSLICIGVIGAGLIKVSIEKAPIESVLDTYMQNIVANDIESAYALFSPRMQSQMPKSDIEQMTEGNNIYLFDGYKSLSVQNINISATVATNPDLPQGTVAKVSGIIFYEGEFTGQFSAVLEKVDGEWKIFGLNITVPPNKFP